MRLHETIVLLGLSWFFALIVATQVLPLEILLGDFFAGILFWLKLRRQTSLLRLNLPRPPASNEIECLPLAA